MPRRAAYDGALALLVALSQTLSVEPEDIGVQRQVLCPGIVAAEFPERQGTALSAVPRTALSAVPRTALSAVPRTARPGT
jgi:short-subunit dehydrogenase